jgi:hypothetical protein
MWLQINCGHIFAKTPSVGERPLICRNLTHRWFMVPFLFLAVLSGCCKGFDSATTSNNNIAREWLRSWQGDYDWTQITSWSSVAQSKLTTAETELQTKAWASLTSEKARELVGESSASMDGRTPYLLRAVGDAGGKWPLEVYIRPNGEVWTGGGANSDCAVPMKRRAVVAWLQRPPSQVYVTFVVGR